jgi:hypothetical protein
MADTTAAPEIESPLTPTEQTQSADARPQVSSILTVPQLDKQAHAASMTDQELIQHIQNKLRPVGYTRTCIAKKVIRTTQPTGMVEQGSPFAENHSMRNGSAS